MRASLAFIAALFIGAFGAHFLMEDRGYVLLRFRGYNVETSVPVLILMLLLAYATVRIALRLLQAPRNIGRAAGSYRRNRAQHKLMRGLSDLDAGKWARGERLLARSASHSDTPLLHYLGAARAAQRQGAPKRRDAWLKLAYEEDPDNATAVLLTQAQLQLDEGEGEEALVTLHKLQKLEPDHPQGLALQARACEALGAWQELRALLPRLRRLRALPIDALDRLERQTQLRALAAAGADGNAEAVRALWRGLPRHLRDDPELQRGYVAALCDGGDHDTAEDTVRKALKKRWDAALVSLYGELETGDGARQLKRAEAWLKNRPEDPALLATAARLSMREELWGKARSYLESSLAIEPRVDSYLLYGRLLEQLGESDEAAGAFRTGLSMATGKGVTELPALKAPEPH